MVALGASGESVSGRVQRARVGSGRGQGMARDDGRHCCGCRGGVTRGAKTTALIGRVSTARVGA